MTTFDSVPPDVPVIAYVRASIFRAMQSWAPWGLHAGAIVLYILVFFASHDARGQQAARLLLLSIIGCILRASYLRRVAPYLFNEVGSYRYYRVTSAVTRLLPNTRQSWIVVMNLAALVIGLPLFMYLFTHYTAHQKVYGLAMFGLAGTRTSIMGAYVIGSMLSLAVMGLTYALVVLPLGGRNPLFVAEASDRVRTWIRLVSWQPMIMVLQNLFIFSRLLLCGGPVGRYGTYENTVGCGTGSHFFAGLFAWFMIAVSYISLDIGQEYVRLLGGGPVTYYALEPRLDGFFSELLIWSLKMTTGLVTFVDPLVATLSATGLFTALFVFTFIWRTSTVEALEELIRWSMLTVAVTCAVSAALTSRSIPAVVPGLVGLLCWVLAVAGAVTMYLRRFGWELFASSRDVTADIMIV